ncbi:Expansin-A18 [Ananas comosus]|uniref:Expansin n=1 Tax=Ananas comosus TaxID=4615 RepID=A0A199W8K1_ANACO|nr:Expansin-A18 [Ananas comosus]
MASSFRRPRSIGRLLVALAVLMAIAVTRVDANFQTSDWSLAHATFYGDETASATMGGACGYGNLYSTGYGTATAALSSVLFNEGYGCGGCYEIRCTGATACYAGSPSIVVTGTNLCPPNWAEASDDGGWCNPPRVHFDMSKPAFMQIADWNAGIVPFQGNAYWLLVYVLNVGGSGDVCSIDVKGDSTDWISMTHNWGASFQAFANLGGQALSFRLTTCTSQETLILYNVADAGWSVGLTYEGDSNFF